MIEQKKSVKGSWLWGALVFPVLVLIDMVTKILADAYYDYGDPYFKIIPGYLEWGLTYNRGVAFSMMHDAPTPAKIALVWSTAVLFVVFAVYYIKLDPRRTWVRVALIFIIAGGVGNLIDRVYYQMWISGDPAELGGVRDMVYLNVVMNFGVCNFADFFICIGSAVLVVAMVFFDQDALLPLGKYKEMAKQAMEKEEQKKIEKQAKKGENNG